MRLRTTLFVISLGLIICSCKKDNEKEKQDNPPLRTVNVPVFNGDSAYNFVKRQVDFGPRIPNSNAHKKAGDFLVSQLKKSGAIVTEQNFEATTFDGQQLNLRNIIASYSPEKQKRILLTAHWDTRPFADRDIENKNALFDGANDGASGVAVLLEIARAINANKQPEVGIDLILFDGEDWGEREGVNVTLPEGLESWWCLGSQYWAKHKHKANYSAHYGILLDMVGARRAHFYREGLSLEYASKVVDNIWSTAERIGYSDYFVKQNVGEITDDHQFLNKVAKIPTVDIVDYKPGIGFFGEYHHSRKDNLGLIDKASLQAVGATLLNVIYYEEP
jgi:glutaminyl-peptide cyclotransferase